MPKQITFIRTLGVDEGLSQGMIFSIMQDKEGFMWLGTKDGLNRYDGYAFNVFKKTASPYSLQDNWVQDIEEDEQGNFWILTLTKGLYLFNKKTERFYPVTLPGINSTSKTIWQNINVKDHFLHVCNSEGIFVYTTSGLSPSKYEDRNRFIKLCSKLPQVYGYKLVLTREGGFWVSNETQDSMLLFQPDKTRERWERKAFTAEQYRRQIPVEVRDTSFDFVDNNRLFVFRKDQLSIYDYTSSRLIKVFRFQGGGRPNYQAYIHGVQELQFNYDGMPGIYRLNMNTMELIHDKSQAHRDISGYFRDRTNLVWVNTNGYGISLTSHEPVTFKQIFLPVRCGGVPNDIYYDKIKGGVYLYDRERHSSKQLLSPAQYNPYGNYNYLILDKDSVLWLSRTNIYGRFSSYDFKTGKLETIHDKTAGIFRFMFAGMPGRLWIQEAGNGYSRIREYDKHQKKFIRQFDLPAKEAGDFLMYNAYTTGNGIYWIASQHGLIRFAPDQQDVSQIWHFYKHQENDPHSLSECKLLSVCPDPKQPDRYLWLGTEGQGVDRFDITTGKCIHITEKDGLPNNVAYGMLADRQGNLWISTNMGLCCYTPPSMLNQKGIFRNFTKEDGLPGNEFNRYEFYYAPHGELEFSGVNGGVRFLPERVLKAHDAVPVYFTSLHVNNKLVEVGDSTGILKEGIMYCKQIQLTHEQNIFTLKFASLDYRNTKGKKYQYYLDGFTKEWTHPSIQNEVSYTNLNPGSYTFHLKGSNCDGVWNENETILEIIILPAWYQTWWFKLMCLLGMISAIYALYRYKVQQLLKLQKLRNHIASDLHDELGSTLSSISLSADLIENSIGNKAPEAKLLLRQISNNVSQMMESMSDIVWTINSKNDSFKSIIRRMRSFAAEMLEPVDMEFTFHVQHGVEDMKLDMQQRKNVYLVFKESIHNIVKYSRAHQIHIDLVKEKDYMKLSVEDDGIGFDTNTISNEFGGNGLYNMRKRAEELKGHIQILSEKTKGTQVVMYFKIH